MRRIVLFGFALLAIAMSSSTLVAAPFTFDAPGDVVLSPTQAAGTWYTDRYAPAVFASGQSGGGRTGVLQHGIAGGDLQANSFYNTQGRKYDFSPGLTSAFIEMYIPASWDTIVQAPGSGRLGSIWATAFNSVDSVNPTAYPILAFSNEGNTFQVWDGAAYQNVGGFVGFDQWYDIGFAINGSQFDFFVNGNLVYSDTNIGGSTQFGNLILQGANNGTSYDIFWDNLRPDGQALAAEVPEPASLAVWGLVGMAGAAYGWRKRRTKK